eukprot:5041282-Pleurochrysis_carterae.AAC.6
MYATSYFISARTLGYVSVTVQDERLSRRTCRHLKTCIRACAGADEPRDADQRDAASARGRGRQGRVARAGRALEGASADATYLTL